jgi:hypothetical protein
MNPYLQDISSRALMGYESSECVPLVEAHGYGCLYTTKARKAPTTKAILARDPCNQEVCDQLLRELEFVQTRGRCANTAHTSTDSATTAQFKCGACSAVLYCSAQCQRAHWASHKTDCAPFTSALSDASRRSAFAKGTQVRLHQLADDTNNGLEGTVLAVCDPVSGRQPVRVHSSGRTLLVRPKNLLAAPRGWDAFARAASALVTAASTTLAALHCGWRAAGSAAGMPLPPVLLIEIDISEADSESGPAFEGPLRWRATPYHCPASRAAALAAAGSPPPALAAAAAAAAHPWLDKSAAVAAFICTAGGLPRLCPGLASTTAAAAEAGDEAETLLAVQSSAEGEENLPACTHAPTSCDAALTTAGPSPPTCIRGILQDRTQGAPASDGASGLPQAAAAAASPDSEALRSGAAIFVIVTAARGSQSSATGNRASQQQPAYMRMLLLTPGIDLDELVNAHARAAAAAVAVESAWHARASSPTPGAQAVPATSTQHQQQVGFAVFHADCLRVEPTRGKGEAEWVASDAVLAASGRALCASGAMRSSGDGTRAAMGSQAALAGSAIGFLCVPRRAAGVPTAATAPAT